MTRVITGMDELRSLERLWTRKVEQAGSSTTPFQSFSWIENWLEHRVRGIEPFVLVFDDDLIAPLGRVRVGPVRILRLLGTGDSDYPGLVSSHGIRESWARVGAELDRQRRHWDLLHLHSVLDPQAIMDALHNSLGAHVRSRQYDVCPRIDTRVPFEELVGVRDKKLRRELRRWERRLDELGDVSLQAHPTPAPAGLFDELIEVESRSWKWENSTAGLLPGPRRDFLKAVLEDPRTQACLWLLRSRERLVAFALVLTDVKQWYFYHTSYRDDARAAGSHLLGRIVRAACESQCEFLDLLRGPQAYKLLWTDETRAVHEIALASGARGRAASLAYLLRWTAARRPVLHRLRNRTGRLARRFQRRRTPQGPAGHWMR